MHDKATADEVPLPPYLGGQRISKDYNKKFEQVMQSVDRYSLIGGRVP